MASSVAKQPRIKCDKGGGITTCSGCQQWFCTMHFIQHRQELVAYINHACQQDDFLQQNLFQENTPHPLTSSQDSGC